MNNIFYSVILSLIIISSIFYNGCSDDSIPFGPITPPVGNLIPLDTAYAIGGRARVFMYSDEALKTGYNKIYIVLYDSVTGDLITDAHIEFSPVNHGVSAPVENPPSTTTNGIFEGAIIFTDPQTLSDNFSHNNEVLHWHLGILVHNHQASGEPEGHAEISGLQIASNPEGFVKYYTPGDSTLYLFSYIKPKSPVAGLNDFEFLVNKKVNDAFFPDATMNIHVQPVLLPSGTQSTGNTDPVASSNGHYNGKVNLTQSGTWKLNLHFSNSVTNDSVYFERSF